MLVDRIVSLVKKNVYDFYKNLGGVKANGKLITFQSDDWGSERIPSRQVYNSLNKTLNLDQCPYSKFDALETLEDIEALSNVLSSFKDIMNVSPSFTLNFNVANPDFEKIKESKYLSYDYIDLFNTYDKYGENFSKIVRKLLDDPVFSIGYHGREHVNNLAWLSLIRENKLIYKAASYEMYALSYANVPDISFPYLATFKPYSESYLIDHKIVFDSGLKLFQNAFGFRANTFIAPVYIWHKTLEELFAHNGGSEVQGLRLHMFENITEDLITYNRVKHSKSVSGLLNNSVRNCFFEPSTNEKINWIDQVLREIEIAFLLRKPAVICTHRLNYVSRLSVHNRDANLLKLNILIEKILLRWPDVRFF